MRSSSRPARTRHTPTGPARPLSPASAEVSLTSSTGVLTCPDEGSSVVISCLVHDVVQGGDDARASGGGPWFGDAIVDGSGGRRRAGRPGGPVPGLSHRYRPVAEHGQGLWVLMPSSALMGLCRPHSYADLSVNWLARGPVVAGVIGIILSLSRIVTIDACLVTIAVAGDVNSLEAAMNGRQRAAHPSRVKVTGPLAGYADGFRQALAERGYHPQVIGRQALLMADLSVWLESCGLSGGALTRSEERRAGE